MQPLKLAIINNYGLPENTQAVPAGYKTAQIPF
jgi:hypothetical protein